MIVGFDHDDPSIFEVMPKFLAEARVSAALIGMLHAIPTTPLYERLKNAGRLNDEEARDRYGTNVIPLRMSRDELRNGFTSVMQRSYTADAYFQRLDALFIEERFKFVLHQLPYWWSHPWAWTKRLMGNYLKFIVVAGRLLRFVKDDTLRSRYRQQLSRIICARGFEPHILFIYAIKVAMHYHFAAIAHALAQVEDANGSLPDAGRSFSRARKQPTEAQALAS